MEKYQNRGGDSGVSSYESGKDYIAVKYSRTAQVYRYTYESAGAEVVEEMKRLAECGEGLNAFVNRHQPGFLV